MTQSIKNAEFQASSRRTLAQKIDHTLLKPTMTRTELEKLCREAAEYHFKTVCIPPIYVAEASALLKGSSVDVITVVGFPLGYTFTEAKALEAKTAIAHGAKEIDMVINVSFLKDQRLAEIEADIRGVVAACGSIPLKVIIETAYLNDAEKVAVALICENAGAAFVKTSTGFATPPAGISNGATLADIQLLRQTLKPTTQIKASGGIRDFEGALKMIEAGADRLGTSAGVAILNGLTNEGSY